MLFYEYLFDCHPRENGDPVYYFIDSRLRGNDNGIYKS